MVYLAVAIGIRRAGDHRSGQRILVRRHVLRTEFYPGSLNRRLPHRRRADVHSQRRRAGDQILVGVVLADCE